MEPDPERLHLEDGPAHLTHSVVALGVVKTAMGLPLFGIGLWLTWLLVRRHRTDPAPAQA